MPSNEVGHLTTSTIITLQHFATHHPTTLHYTYETSLHLSTLHFLSFTLHYPLIWLNPLTFPIVLFHHTSLNWTKYSPHIPQLISKIMNPFPALKNLSSFLFTFYSFFLFFTSYQPFTSLHFAVHLYNSLPFTSLPFTFYFLSHSLPPLFYTFLTLVLKTWVLPWEVPIAPSGSWFQSVMDLTGGWRKFIILGLNDLYSSLNIFISMAQQPIMGDGLLIEASRSHSDTPHPVGLLRTSYRPTAETSTWQHTTLTRRRQPCPGWDSNPQSQQANGRRQTP